MFTNGYHLDYGVTRLCVYNVTDMLSDKDKLCARITNLSSIEVEVILVTLIVCMYSIEYLAVSKYCLSHYFSTYLPTIPGISSPMLIVI